MNRMVRKIRVRIVSEATKRLLRSRGIVVGSDCSFFGVPIFDRVAGSDIVLGDRCTLISEARFTALGVSRPVIVRSMLPGAVVSIGDDTGMSGVVICASERVEIGSGVLIGADVIISDTDFHPLSPNRRRAPLSSATRKPVTIEDDVFIGARSIVLKGVTIGMGAVVGAGAVVTRDVEPMTIVAGNPARVVAAVPPGSVS